MAFLGEEPHGLVPVAAGRSHPIRQAENPGSGFGSDIEEARDALFKAYGRGLPFFSAGVRWLLNGLTIFADDDDTEAREMAKRVHRVSLRTDMSQPFTVIRMGPRSL